MRPSTFLLVICMAAVAPSQSRANDLPLAVSDLWERPALLDGGGGPKDVLKAHGIIVDGGVTQFYQGVVSGDGSHQWEYGGKVDLAATFVGDKLGLWRGLFVSVHQEWLYGEDVNGQGDGSLIPLNTAMGFPRLGGHDRDTSIVVTQNFGEQLSVSAGKFNLLDVAAKTPIVGGGGLETFMNTTIAAPISGVTPPYLLGAIATLKTEPATFTLMVYDPRNAQSWDVIENPFEKGTTVSLSVTVPTKFGGLTGFYGVRGVYSTKEGLDLADMPQLLLPPEAQGKLTKKGYWFASASVQQYLYQDPDNPAAGWGLFGDFGISDGNPNAVAWHVLGGVGGTGTLPSRPLDRWGVGYFKYALSDDLIASLNTLGIPLADEQGIEAYYNLALTPWQRITADVQWIDTGRADRDEAWVLGVRSQTKF